MNLTKSLENSLKKNLSFLQRTNKKIINVSIVKEALDLANENVNDADFHLLCKRLFKKHFNEDCKVEYCYF